MTHERRRRQSRGTPAENDRVWAEYGARFRQEVLPSLLNSAAMIHISEGPEVQPDIQAATEIGLFLLMDRPLIVLVPPGKCLPEPLRRAAAIIIDDWDTRAPASQDRLADALKTIQHDDPPA